MIAVWRELLGCMEGATTERGMWKCVDVSSGAECVMIAGMNRIQLLYAANLDWQVKVTSMSGTAPCM